MAAKETLSWLKNSTNVRVYLEAITKFGLRVTEEIAPGLAARWAEQLFLTPRRHARPA